MSLEIRDLTCNYMTNPVGMDEAPYFSYRLTAENPSERLQAYQIRVLLQGKTIWDSGRVDKDEQVLIPYQGPALLPETRYEWMVTVWNAAQEKTESETAYFETGRMQPLGWAAKWITYDPIYLYIGGAFKEGPETTAPYLRKEFDIKKPVKEATLYISGVGYYQCWVNGVSVKDTVLDPPFTEYDKAVMYCTHKVRNLQPGRNAIGIALGDGFYNADPLDIWNFANAVWRDQTKCICELKICYEDGSEERVLSDASFKGNTGPILSNAIRGMEEYDARRELGAWTMPGYDDSEWKYATVTKAPGGVMEGHYSTPIRITDEFLPESIHKVSDTTWIVDAGKGTSGWVELSVTAPAGVTIHMMYDEYFDENLKPRDCLTHALQKDYWHLFQTNSYTTSGKGRECWHPVYQYNGFRYIKVTCETGIPENIAFKIQEVRSDLPLAGEFTCSHPLVNRIQEATCNATKTCFHNMPTDCPHREKLGWMGDAQISCEQTLYNYEAAAPLYRWMSDIIRAQRISGQLPGIVPSTGWGYNWGGGPAWDGACAVIPDLMHLYRGDTRILEKMYPCIKKHIAFMDTMAVDGILEYGLDDWNPPRDSWHRKCELAVTDTLYYYNSIRVAGKIAGLLGFPEEEVFYREKAAAAREIFRSHFMEKTDGELILKNCTMSQATLACMMYYGVVNEEEKPLFLQELIREIHEMDDHFDVGAIGMLCICNVLVEAGEAELMMNAVLNPTYPSYADLIVNKGATTLWEDFAGIGSFHHHYYGSVSAGFYKGIAGILPSEEQPGFKHTVFKPQFVSMLDHAFAWHMSPYGKVESKWVKDGEKIHISLTVPVNCTGELRLPKGTALEDTGETRVFLSGGSHKLEARYV